MYKAVYRDYLNYLWIVKYKGTLYKLDIKLFNKLNEIICNEDYDSIDKFFELIK